MGREYSTRWFWCHEGSTFDSHIHCSLKRDASVYRRQVRFDVDRGRYYIIMSPGSKPGHTWGASLQYEPYTRRPIYIHIRPRYINRTIRRKNEMERRQQVMIIDNHVRKRERGTKLCRHVLRSRVSDNFLTEWVVRRRNAKHDYSF